MCYAAELHDIGYLDSEQNPALNPATGLPLTFYELMAAQRLKVWQAGIFQMRRVSSYSAVLMSMHYCGLSEKHPERQPADRELMRKFREEQEEFRRELLQNLAGKNDFSEAIGESTLRYHSRLLAAWDLISLHLCMNPGESFQIPDVPSSKKATGELRLVAQPGDRWRFALFPWPFSQNELGLRYEGSILQGKFSAEDKLRQALDRAEPAVIEVELVPASSPT